MKRIPLLLAALGVVSAAAYAAPELTVTSVGQEVEIEHTNGSDDTTAWLYNNVGLAYGDWSFGFQGAKQWNYDNDDNGVDKEGKGISSANNRVQFDAWRKINDNLKLGFRYRGQKDMDRFMARYDFNYGMFLSSGDFWYQFNNNNAEDNIEMEWFPIGVKIGPVTAKYLLNYKENNNAVKSEESYTEHQIRLYAPLYKWDRLSLSTEARITLHAEKDMVNDKDYTTWEDFGRNRLYLKANYAVSEDLNVYVNYAYEFNENERRNGSTADESVGNYQNLTFGWNYKF